VHTIFVIYQFVAGLVCITCYFSLTVGQPVCVCECVCVCVCTCLCVCVLLWVGNKISLLVKSYDVQSKYTPTTNYYSGSNVSINI